MEPTPAEGASTREARNLAIRTVPFASLNQSTGQQIREVLESPTFFRRMPKQQIDCDPQMFTFLVRRPEVMVNIWDMMGITKVSAQRTSPFSFMADDGVGTACKCDLVYGDADTHIYVGTGEYDGSMVPRKVTGRCVCILHAESGQSEGAQATVAGTMDVFLKIDNLGADLLARSIGPFVGKTADYNFVETAKFISQVSQICRVNPEAAQGLAMRLDKVDEPTRREFASIAARIATQANETPAGGIRNSQFRTPLEVREEPVPFKSELRLDEPAPQLVLSGSGPDDSRAPPPTASSPQLTNAQLTKADPHTRPSAIRPQKPNIYMRR
jgi:hypothetical protein